MIINSFKKFLAFQKFLYEYQYQHIDNYIAYVNINTHKIYSLKGVDIDNQHYIIIRWES